MIGVDDDSLQRFGRWQDWPRRNHGLLLHALAAAPEKPAVVGWDILFPEPSPDDDHLVEGAAALPGRVIFAAYATDDAPLDAAAPDELAPDLTQPITRIEGDAAALFSASHAMLPIAALRSVCAHRVRGYAGRQRRGAPQGAAARQRQGPRLPEPRAPVRAAFLEPHGGRRAGARGRGDLHRGPGGHAAHPDRRGGADLCELPPRDRRLPRAAAGAGPRADRDRAAQEIRGARRSRDAGAGSRGEDRADRPRGAGVVRQRPDAALPGDAAGVCPCEHRREHPARGLRARRESRRRVGRDAPDRHRRPALDGGQAPAHPRAVFPRRAGGVWRRGLARVATVEPRDPAGSRRCSASRRCKSSRSGGACSRSSASARKSRGCLARMSRPRSWASS